MLECPASSANTRTLTSTLVNNGATLYRVQKMLGHSRSATTERYAHLANHRLQQAVSFGVLIDEYLSS
jgi:integrase